MPAHISVSQILDQLLVSSSVTILCAPEAQEIIRRLISQAKYDQESRLKRAGLMEAGEKQKLRFTYNEKKKELKITLNNPLRFEVVGLGLMGAGDSSRGER